MEDLILLNSKPKNRSEQEVAGYTSGNYQALRDLYKKHVEFGDTKGLKTLVKAGVIEENKSIAKFIKSFRSHSSTSKKAA